MSDPEPAPGAQAAPGPESETGAANTEVFASAAFATGPGEGPDAPAAEAAQNTDIPGQTAPGGHAADGSIPGSIPGSVPGGHSAGESAPGGLESGQYIPGGYAPGADAAGIAVVFGAARPGPPAVKARRGRWIVGLGAAYVVLAAGTAFGVIAGTSPAAVDVTAVNASAYAGELASASAAATPTSSASAKAKAGASASSAPTSAPPTSASPTSTVTGSVSGGVHKGDLRFFLLPPPQGPSSVQGDPDGDTESLDDVVQEYGGTSDVRSLLKQLSFKAACARTYQDSTIGANVNIELIRFASSSDASNWFSGFALDGAGFKHISVPGESGADGWSYEKDGNYQLVGVYRDGDTFFNVTIYATQSIPASALGSIIKAQHSRLANG